jgi:protein TonB
MAFAPAPGRTRIGGAIAAAAIELAIAVLVVSGLAVSLSAPVETGPALVTVTLRPPAPPPPPATPRNFEAQIRREARGEAPPPTAVPSQAIVLSPPRVATGEISGADAARGAVQGAGSGQGSGTGAGDGSGTAATPPLRVAGALGDRDYPRGARRIGGTVAIAFRVRGDGRVDGCRVIASSGSSVLDELTCDLVEKRFRYRPARDAEGQAVDAAQRTSFTWGTRPRE